MTNTQNTETVNEVVNEVAIIKEDLAMDLNPSIFEGNAESALFSSIQATDRKSAIKVFNAINSSENSLADHVGKTLEIQDMVAHAITLQDEVTKEDIQAMRIVLVTKDGTAYHSVSQGVTSSLQKVISIVGPAPWVPGLKVTPKNVNTRRGFKTLTLQLSE